MKVRILAVVLLCALSGPPLVACSCTEFLNDPAKALKKSGLVFAGEVISVETISLPQVMYTRDDRGEFVPFQFMARRGLITFKVLKQWKGESAVEYKVLAGPPPERPLPSGEITVGCEAYFETAKQYLVFATDGYAEANICAPTGLLEESASVVSQLDRIMPKPAPKKPVPPSN